MAATAQANGSVLLQAPAAAEYHWLKGGVPIANAASSTYLVSVSGSYSVLIVSADGCSSKPSDPVALVIVGDIYDAGMAGSRSFPNPAEGTLYYIVENSTAEGTIYSASGAEIHVNVARTREQMTFDVSGLSPGLYLLKIEEEGVVKTIWWVKK